MRQTACAPWLVRSAAAPGREPHLPIEQPTRLGLILNLKTAKALGGAGRTRTNEKSVSQTVGINSKSADDLLVSTGTQPRPPPLSTSISTRGSAGGWWCGPSSRDINVLKLNNQRSIIDVAFAF